MSIKDRNAKVENRKRITGVVAGTRDDEEPATMEGFRGQLPVIKGIPDPNSVRVGPGIAYPMPGSGDDIPILAKPVCAGITKKGAACKASPIRGEELCVGHSRQWTS